MKEGGEKKWSLKEHANKTNDILGVCILKPSLGKKSHFDVFI